MSSKTLSLIVPTFNMADYLPALWQSLAQSNTLDRLQEIIFVNDGSTDSTVRVIDELSRNSAKVKRIDLEGNLGRYQARWRGARAATTSHILFLDARTELTPEFGETLTEFLNSHDALMAVLRIDVKKSVFNLYWQRSHEWIFKKNFEDARKGFYLTPENYESYAKGTTMFLCPRAEFIKACERFGARDLHSDDTYLMREIVKSTPIWVQERLAIYWEPRQDYYQFLRRLWERGPQFAEYHVFERKGLYFYLFLLWTIAVVGSLILLLVKPLQGLQVLGLGLTLLSLSAALFAKSVSEFLRIIPVHIGTILAYGFGAIYGVGVNLKLFKKPSPTGAKSSSPTEV